MSGLSLHQLAVALNGEVNGYRVLAPGPGHSRIDRSLSVRLSSSAPGGFVVKSFADDDFAACRDHVGAALGLPSDFWRTRRQDVGTARAAVYVPSCEVVPHVSDSEKIARARAIWDAGVDAHGTCVERYLASRGLTLPDGADALRFNRSTPWRENSGEVVRVPAMIAAMRQIEGDTITAVHKTRLTLEGAKVERKMQGKAGGAAVKLDADDEVTSGLAIGEGIETVLAARQLGFRPTWALASAGAIASFPLLAGIETLTVLSEPDEASDRAVEQVSSRWLAARREVVIVSPTIGSDLNDAIRGAA